MGKNNVEYRNKKEYEPETDDEARGDSRAGKQPKKQMAFPRWMHIEIRWKRNAHSRASPVTAVKRWPSSLMKLSPSELMGPIDSQASGMKICEFRRAVYFVIFLADADSAAQPAVIEVKDK